VSHHLILLAHATPDVAPMFGAAAAARGLDVDVVPIRSPYAGMSAAYDALAHACLQNGRVLPGLLAKYKPPRQGYASTWLVCWSGSYALARAMRPADRAELAGLVLLDGGHTTLDRDNTASDAGVQWLVDWAREAKAGRSTLWIGHTDVRTYGNVASTTKVAEEVLKLAGGQGGRFLVRAHNVATDDKAEHVAARDGWGPTFAADAMASGGAAPTESRDTPEPPSTEREPPRALKRGAKGPDVLAWQERLIALGYDPGAPDGAFGPLVERATKEFQGDAHLKADGVVGPKTRAAAEMVRPRPQPAAPPDGLAAAALARAVADLEAGVCEERPNDGERIGQYLRRFDIEPPADWCSVTASSWILDAAEAIGTVAPVIGSAGAKTLEAQFRRAGRFIDADDLLKDPLKLRDGMLIFWDRTTRDDWRGHVGIKRRTVSGTKVKTVEGNSGAKGDRVAEMDRDLRDPKFRGAGWLDG
jgi:peptidoglycan hydrolase-like protein with peptidoglycan-binding domain